jgi:hypothetical protein
VGLDRLNPFFAVVRATGDRSDVSGACCRLHVLVSSRQTGTTKQVCFVLPSAGRDRVPNVCSRGVRARVMTIDQALARVPVVYYDPRAERGNIIRVAWPSTQFQSEHRVPLCRTAMYKPQICLRSSTSPSTSSSFRPDFLMLRPYPLPIGTDEAAKAYELTC